MRNRLRNLQNFGIYLLPAFLLATTSALLIALLYYPTPLTAFSGEARIVTATEGEYGRTLTETGFAALSADVLRQLQAEQKPQARTLMYQYESGAAYGGEQPAIMLRAAPLFEKGGDSGRSVLTRL